MSMEKLKNRKRGKVFPDDDDEELINNGCEMKHLEKSNTWKARQHEMKNPIKVISNLKHGAVKWKQYINDKRPNKSTKNALELMFKTTKVNITNGKGNTQDLDRRKTGGNGLDLELDETQLDILDGNLDATTKQTVVAQNRNLIEYFAKLASPKLANEKINLEYVHSLLRNGAKIDCTDKYGQTILHEAARAWHPDVAKFLIDNGADINKGDNFNRTPLHVASAVDYAEMVTFLIEYGANKEAMTKHEHQTPVHFAARNDACSSLKALIKAGCRYKLVRDYKQRTPLHLAAELDRSETARTLLELEDPAPAGVEDSSGQSAIVWMITKMPPVAKIALDQFHTTDRANRKQFYFLNCLEPVKPVKDPPVHPQTALQVIVTYRRYDLILHPVFMKLIKLKWHSFGRRGTLFNLCLNLIFIMLWTAQGILIDYDQRHHYNLPSQWWRIVLFIAALFSTGWQIKDELMEFFGSKKAHRNWEKWRQSEIDRDIANSHPRWPEEEQYLRQEINELDETSAKYFKDFWNIFDWIVYTLLLIVIITHVIDVCNHSNFVARMHIRIMAITVILLWLRLMKNARAFSTLGPFIVMISHMVGDCLKFAFLYIQFFIPFVCAFWMIFGGTQVLQEYQGTSEADNNTIAVGGMDNFNALLFSMFRITLVDDYDYDGMKSVDSFMADILVGLWLAISAILMLNLFIALMSDTFQRVYDNAQANAVMQKAIAILTIEESIGAKKRAKFREFIREQCSPLMEFYDDDLTDSSGQDLQKVTIQIKDSLDVLIDSWELHFGSIRPESELNESSEAIKHRRKSRVQNEELDLLSENFHNSLFDLGNQEYHDSETDNRMVTMGRFRTELRSLKDDVNQMRHDQTEFASKIRRDLNSMKKLLQHLVISGPGDGDAYDGKLLLQQEAYSDASSGRNRTPRRKQGSQIGKRGFGQRRPDTREDMNLERRRKKELKKLRGELEALREAQGGGLGLVGSPESAITVDVSDTPSRTALNDEPSRRASASSSASATDVNRDDLD